MSCRDNWVISFKPFPPFCPTRTCFKFSSTFSKLSFCLKIWNFWPSLSFFALAESFPDFTFLVCFHSHFLSYPDIILCLSLFYFSFFFTPSSPSCKSFLQLPFVVRWDCHRVAPTLPLSSISHTDTQTLWHNISSSLSLSLSPSPSPLSLSVTQILSVSHEFWEKVLKVQHLSQRGLFVEITTNELRC